VRKILERDRPHSEVAQVVKDFAQRISGYAEKKIDILIGGTSDSGRYGGKDMDCEGSR